VGCAGEVAPKRAVGINGFPVKIVLAGGLGALGPKRHLSLTPVTQTSHSKTPEGDFIEGSTIPSPLMVNSGCPSTFPGRLRQNVCGEMQSQMGEHSGIARIETVLSTGIGTYCNPHRASMAPISAPVASNFLPFVYKSEGDAGYHGSRLTSVNPATS
jgi:hypothetical protein